MGVLACNRGDCENIMCLRGNSKYGYICDECFEELCYTDISIEEFMNSKKKEKENRREYLNIIFTM